MPDVRQLGRRFGDHLRKEIDSAELPANVGFRLPNGRYSPQGDDTNIEKLPSHKCYVRLLNEDNQTQVALVGPITLWPDLPVMVKRNFRGELKVVSLDESRAANYLNEQMRDFQSPPKSGAGYDVMPASSLLDGRLLWGPKTGLTVTVQPFFYPYLDSIKHWNQTSYIDLADYLPATTSAWGWGVVCIDPKDNTISVQASAEYSLKTLLTTTTLLAVDTSGLIALAGVTLQEAQTAYNSAKNSITYIPNIHNYGSPVVDTVYGTGLIGANRQIKVDGDVLVSGDLEIKGELIAA